MGEKKRRQQYEQFATDLTRVATDKGKLLETGFAAFLALMAPKAPPEQVAEMQIVFMAGAEHAWSSIMNLLDPDAEPTAADLRRMELIQREIDEWRGKLSERIHPSQGNA